MEEDQAIGRLPKQKRGEETREKLIEAGKNLFSAEGYHTTSSKKIARAAGVATGSFYNYFSDKKELLFEIYRRHINEVHEMIGRSLMESNVLGPGVDERTMIRAIIEQAIQMHDFSPELHREIAGLMYTDPDFSELGRKEEEEASMMLMGILKSRPKKLRDIDLEAAAMIVEILIEKTVHSMLIFGAPIERERMINTLADIICRTFYEE